METLVLSFDSGPDLVRNLKTINDLLKFSDYPR